MIPPRNFAQLCTWCGHRTHTLPCGRDIQTTPTATAPCPCQHHRKDPQP